MKQISTRTVTGILIIIVGLALLLSSLNVWNFGDVVSTWWPLVIVAVGVILFINDHSAYLWSLLVVAFGTILQLNHLDVIDVNPWQLIWPVVIIVVGVSILTSRAAAGKKLSKADRHDVTAVLSGSEQKNNSQDYKGGKVTAIMGGASIDLRKAIINKEATLDLFAFWGGIEIVVPENVVVKNQISNILGGTEDKTTSPTKKDAPILNIIGDVVMAGVEIKN